MKKSVLLSLSLICLLAVGMNISADQSVKANSVNNDVVLEKSSIAAIELRIENLSHQIDLWHDAILKGDLARSQDFEKDIIKTMEIDLDETKDIVRYFATKTTLKDNGKAQNNNPEVSDSDKDAFQKSLSLLNTKEQVSLSFARTDAFSNKYRLISDYVDLLRKQLDMPRIKLAFEKNNQNKLPIHK